MNGWNTILSYWGPAYFQGLWLLVSGRVTPFLILEMMGYRNVECRKQIHDVHETVVLNRIRAAFLRSLKQSDFLSWVVPPPRMPVTTRIMNHF